jgi:diguanylate cyclase (GGDEF)-like protein
MPNSDEGVSAPAALAGPPKGEERRRRRRRGGRPRIPSPASVGVVAAAILLAVGTEFGPWPRGHTPTVFLLPVLAAAAAWRPPAVAVLAVVGLAFVVMDAVRAGLAPATWAVSALTFVLAAAMAVVFAREREAARWHASALAAAARRDPLTGLLNRAGFAERLAEICSAGTPVALLYLDLDGFKAINDVHGHAAGDAVLVDVARRLAESVRAGDIAARLGGDEFAALLVGVATTDAAGAVVARLEAALDGSLTIGGRDLVVRASSGLAFGAAGRASPETLLAEADRHMYQSKAAQRVDAPGEP